MASTGVAVVHDKLLRLSGEACGLKCCRGCLVLSQLGPQHQGTGSEIFTSGWANSATGNRKARGREELHGSGIRRFSPKGTPSCPLPDAPVIHPDIDRIPHIVRIAPIGLLQIVSTPYSLHKVPS